MIIGGSRSDQQDRVWVLVFFLLVCAVLFGTTRMASSAGPIKLVIYAYSTQEEVLTQAIFPSFIQGWENETGQELDIEGVFGASGTLAGQINLGAPADLAIFSNQQQVNWLRIGHQIHPDTEPVVIGNTPIVIVLQPELLSKKGITIRSFADLAQPGLSLLHPDPRHSGAGQWAILAEYGSSLLETQNEEMAKKQLYGIWENVCLLAPSARSALMLFELGAADAVITYEQDARLAQARGVPLQIIVPDRTIVAQPVTIIVDRNVTPAERPAAEAFIRYLAGDTGREIYARFHLGPVDPADDGLPDTANFFTVNDLGDWSRAFSELIDDLWDKEIEPRLDLESAPTLLAEEE